MLKCPATTATLTQLSTFCLEVTLRLSLPKKDPVDRPESTRVSSHHPVCYFIC